MKMLGTRALAGVVVGGALLVTACGDDDSDSEDEGATTTEAVEETTSEVEDEAAADEEGVSASGDATEAGTTLALGEPATVPVEDDEGTVEMTVVSIEQGDLADLADFDLDEGVQGMVPYYVTYSFTKVSGGDLEGTGPESEATGLLDDGSGAQELALIGSFDPCDTEYAPAEFDDGESYESCRVYLADEGSPISSVAFLGAYESPYHENPITWEG